MTRPGLRRLECEICGQIREIEAGIRKLYCCAKVMRDVTGQEEEEQPRLTSRPKR